MILEHYIAFSKKIDEMHKGYLKELNEVKKHIKKKFKNSWIYKVELSNEDKYIEELWGILECYLSDDKSIIEIYSCFENQEYKERKEIAVLNKGDNKPPLEHRRYIVLGNFISGEVLNTTKIFDEIDNKAYILSVSQDEDNLYMDVIMALNKTVRVINKDKNVTKRQKILKGIDWDEKVLKASKRYKIKYFSEPVLDMSISAVNDIESCGYSINYTRHYKNEYKNREFFDNMLFEYYNDRNRIPEKFVNKDSIICRVNMEDMHIDETLKNVELKFRDKRVDYPVEKSFFITMGKFEKGKFIEYLSPIDNKNHKVYIDSLELCDPYEGIPKERREAYEDGIEEGIKLLFMTYENPNKNTNLKFYLKNYLDSPIKSTRKSTRDSGKKYKSTAPILYEPTAFNGTIWFITGLNKNGEKHKNGYYLNSEVFDQVRDVSEDEMEIELLYITKLGQEYDMEFSLSENIVSPLNEYKIVEKEPVNIWASIEKDYKCIRFTPEASAYCPKNCVIHETDVEYNKVNIPLGKSRIGGPVVDMPIDVEYPEGLFFAAQINLVEFKDYFFNDYLPQEGFIYVFIDEYGEEGKVIYSDSKLKDLRRVIKEHDNCFYDGRIIKDVYVEEENINERYSEEWSEEEGEKDWNPFAGTEKSKIFGIYTNCQYYEDELKEQLMEDKILLMQIGKDFTGEGILSVRIERSDLERMDFSDCIFEWSQS